MQAYPSIRSEFITRCWEEEPCSAEMEDGLLDRRCSYQSQYLKSVFSESQIRRRDFLQAFASSVNNATMKGRILPDPRACESKPQMFVVINKISGLMKKL